MRKFPVTVVDNFYENPNLVRDFALSLDYEYDTRGEWPGKRTSPLHEVNRPFYDTFCSKLFALFYDYEHQSVKFALDTKFQCIKNYSENPDSALNHGWIHQDTNLEFAGVIYLNPDPPANSGTHIYRQIDPGHVEYYQSEKFKLYSGGTVNEAEYTNQLLENNNKFEETIGIKNVYNRMILFERGEIHGVPSFYSNSDPRLTQVFFVHKVDATCPIVRSKVS